MSSSATTSEKHKSSRDHTAKIPTLSPNSRKRRLQLYKQRVEARKRRQDLAAEEYQNSSNLPTNYRISAAGNELKVTSLNYGHYESDRIVTTTQDRIQQNHERDMHQHQQLKIHSTNSLHHNAAYHHHQQPAAADENMTDSSPPVHSPLTENGQHNMTYNKGSHQMKKRRMKMNHHQQEEKQGDEDERNHTSSSYDENPSTSVSAGQSHNSVTSPEALALFEHYREDEPPSPSTASSQFSDSDNNYDDNAPWNHYNTVLESSEEEDLEYSDVVGDVEGKQHWNRRDRNQKQEQEDLSPLANEDSNHKTGLRALQSSSRMPEVSHVSLRSLTSAISNRLQRPDENGDQYPSQQQKPNLHHHSSSESRVSLEMVHQSSLDQNRRRTDASNAVTSSSFHNQQNSQLLHKTRSSHSSSPTFKHPPNGPTYESQKEYSPSLNHNLADHEPSAPPPPPHSDTQNIISHPSPSTRNVHQSRSSSHSQPPHTNLHVEHASLQSSKSPPLSPVSPSAPPPPSQDHLFELKQKNIQLQHLVYLQKSERTRKEMDFKRRDEWFQNQISLLNTQYNDLLSAHQSLGDEYDRVKEKGFRMLQDHEKKWKHHSDENKHLREKLRRMERHQKHLKEENHQLKEQLAHKELAMKQATSKVQQKLLKTKQEREQLEMQLSEKEMLMSRDFQSQNSEMQQMKLRHKEYSNQLIHMIDTQTEHIMLLEREKLEQNQRIAALEADCDEMGSMQEHYKSEMERMQQHYENAIHEQQASARREHQQREKQLQKKMKQILEANLHQVTASHWETLEQIMRLLSDKSRRVHSLFTKIHLLEKSLQMERQQLKNNIQRKEHQLTQQETSMRSVGELLKELDVENEQFILLQKKMLSLSYSSQDSGSEQLSSPTSTERV